MKEEDFCDVQSLTLTRAACKILKLGYAYQVIKPKKRGGFLEDPNKTRFASIIANLKLIESDLQNKVGHLEAEG